MAEEGAEREMERRASEISCEEERIRRLSERMTRDQSEGGELARERRAKELANAVETTMERGEFWDQKSNSERQPAPQVPLPADGRPKPAVSTTDNFGSGQNSMDVSNSFRVQEATTPNSRPTQKKWPPPRYEQRKDVSAELASSLEAISVKSIVNFRHVTVVPKLVEDVTIAVLHLISHIEEGTEKQPLPKAWTAVQKVLSKPGHLINSLRRYPYAVDAGRVQAADVKLAERVLERTFRVETLQDVHPVASMFYRWLYAAAHYYKLRENKPQTVNPQGGKPQVVPKQTFIPPTRGAAPSMVVPASAPKGGARIAGGRAPAATTAGGPRATASTPPRRVPGVSRPSPGGGLRAPQAASHAIGGTGYVAPLASDTPPRGGPRAKASAPRFDRTRVPARNPGMTRPASMGNLPPPPGASSLLSTSVSGGVGGAANVDMEAWRRELEATRKEVQRMKMMEADMEWTMDREAKAEVQEIKKDEEADLLHWRWQQAEAGKELEEEIRAQDLRKELADSREKSEFTRHVRQEEKETERTIQSEEAQKALDNAAWEEQRQAELATGERKVLEDRIEDTKMVKEIVSQQKFAEKETEDAKRDQETRTAMDFERQQLLAELGRLRKSMHVVQKTYNNRHTGSRSQMSR